LRPASCGRVPLRRLNVGESSLVSLSLSRLVSYSTARSVQATAKDRKMPCPFTSFPRFFCFLNIGGFKAHIGEGERQGDGYDLMRTHGALLFGLLFYASSELASHQFIIRTGQSHTGNEHIRSRAAPIGISVTVSSGSFDCTGLEGSFPIKPWGSGFQS